MTQRFKVIVASASPVVRSRLSRIIGGDPRFDLLGQAGDLSQVFVLSESLEPDIVFVADRLTAAREFEGMRSLFYALDTRYVRIIDDPRRPAGSGAVLTATGAMDEPVIHPGMTSQEIWTVAQQAVSILRRNAPRATAPSHSAVQDQSRKLVVIGASTGGIDALLTLLSAYPADCPPTAIVQHTGRGFGESLVRLLARRCAAEVVTAQDDLPLIPGRVCVAAGSGAHLAIRRGEPKVCQLRSGPPVAGHVPSVDSLFRSAVPFAPDVVGVILTGMGQDGAEGLAQLRHAGCHTIGQDEATSTVYGMPKVAWSIGAVQAQLPIDCIAAEILRACDHSPSIQAVGA